MSSISISVSKDYVDKYGMSPRPALVAFTVTPVYRSQEINRSYTVYLDENKYAGRAPSEMKYTQDYKTVYMLKPSNTSGDDTGSIELFGDPFNPYEKLDWAHLFWDVKETDRLGDKISFGIIAHVLKSFGFKRRFVEEALNLLISEDREIVIQMIEYISWSLGANAIPTINGFLSDMGRQPKAEIPKVLLDAAADGVNLKRHYSSVYDLVDGILQYRFHVTRSIPLITFNQSFKKLQIASFLNKETRKYYKALVFTDKDEILTVVNFSPELGELSSSELKSRKDELAVVLLDSDDYYLCRQTDNSFLKFLDWLKGDDIEIDIDSFGTFLPFLDVQQRNFAIKRFFYDVKRGILSYDSNQWEAIMSSVEYKYYTQMRYVYEEWPIERNVSAEFLVDCLKTFQKTNQMLYQDINGVLDWLIRTSIENQRPVNTHFADFISKCEGGVLINKEFKGFADFYIIYELDRSQFEDGRIRDRILGLRDRLCLQESHSERVPIIDDATGLQLVDPKTNIPLFKEIHILDPIWHPKEDLRNEDRRILDLFVNWGQNPQRNKITDEMIDIDINKEQVLAFSEMYYDSFNPTLSVRVRDEFVSTFFVPMKMRAVVDQSVQLGLDPGATLEDILGRVSAYLRDIFGDTMERDYDWKILEEAKSKTLFGYQDNKQAKCFVPGLKCIRNSSSRRIFCSPVSEEQPNFLTGKKPANCQLDMCFRTGIIKNPNWRAYTLLHLLDIIGYDVMQEADAGWIPNANYRQFSYQINRALRYAKLFVCRKCGHVLFPTASGDYNRYECLYQSCEEYKRTIYLSYCHSCKTGLIDSRDIKKCPNGLYICPSCGTCCSNNYYEMMADRYRRLRGSVPSFIEQFRGLGHKDRGMYYCYKCGALKMDGICPDCGNDSE